MSKLPESIIKEWENKTGPVVFTTVSKEGIPNSIYATCVSLYDNQTIVVADNYFVKTKNNFLNNNKASVLFYTNEDNAYQVKGTVSYYESGEIYEDMKSWNPEKNPGHGAAALKIEEVYSGSEKLL